MRWPLSTTPASFHQLKTPAELTNFFACALYAPDGRPRPAPRSLFAEPLNGSGYPCSDPWRPPVALPHLPHTVGGITTTAI